MQNGLWLALIFSYLKSICAYTQLKVEECKVTAFFYWYLVYVKGHKKNYAKP